MISEKRSLQSQPVNLQIVYLPLDGLKPNPDNARIHSRSQIRKLARGIANHGFVNPALIDSDNNVIAGHGRIEAAKAIGLSAIPTICVGHLNEAQCQALALADNKLHDESSWDSRLLAIELKKLSELDIEFSLETTGFDAGEIDFRIEECRWAAGR
jgi:ParB-like chromosome segregation protein Spo0J